MFELDGVLGGIVETPIKKGPGGPSLACGTQPRRCF